jgi:hypothetical protein
MKGVFTGGQEYLLENLPISSEANLEMTSSSSAVLARNLPKEDIFFHVWRSKNQYKAKR